MLVKGKKNTDVLIKDEKTINQRTEQTYLDNCKRLNKLIEEAEINNSWDEIFLDKTFKKENLHIPVHEKCGMTKNDSDTVYEKRICRCMFYYDDTNNNCIECPLKKKYKNISKRYLLTDAEKPTQKVIKSCGGIDLVIVDKLDNNKEYAVEVKPDYSKETIVRMVAEIFTYTIEFPNMEKSIAFFEGSRQDEDYKKYYSNPEFKKMIDRVHIFKFVEKNNNNGVINFDIVKIK